MREKDLPIDLTKHAVYTKNAKKCVQTLLSRYYDEETASQLWGKIQLQYCEYLKVEPALGGVKDGTVEDEKIKFLVDMSYELTVK